MSKNPTNSTETFIGIIFIALGIILSFVLQIPQSHCAMIYTGEMQCQFYTIWNPWWLLLSLCGIIIVCGSRSNQVT